MIFGDELSRVPVTEENTEALSEEQLESLKKRKSILRKRDRVYNEIGKIFMLISENLANRYNFFLYTFRDEFVLDGILRAVEAFDKFDRNRDNPFSYFTMVIFRAFITRIKVEKQKRKTLDFLIMEDPLFNLQEDDTSGFRRENITDNIEFNGWSSE